MCWAYAALTPAFWILRLIPKALLCFNYPFKPAFASNFAVSEPSLPSIHECASPLEFLPIIALTSLLLDFA